MTKITVGVTGRFVNFLICLSHHIYDLDNEILPIRY